MASKDTAIAAIMEQLIAEGPQAMAQVFTALINLAMRMEREQFFGAGHYERNAERRGYANGAKRKKIDTPAGTVTLDVPKTAGAEKPFFPQSLERGRRSCRAVMLCAAEMYVQGVSTRDVEKVMAEFGIKSLSSTQVSRAAALLDEELEAWRSRPLGGFRYLFLDARYEKTRETASSAIPPCSPPSASSRRASAACSASPGLLRSRGPLARLPRKPDGPRHARRPVHRQGRPSGLKAARRAVLPGALWQRCQFHLAQNAIHHAPNPAIRKPIGAELRAVWDAPAWEARKRNLSGSWPHTVPPTPKLADWLENNVPEGLAVFNLPGAHQRRMRTANPIERAIQQEIKRRTSKVRVFPNRCPCSVSPPPSSSKSTSNGLPRRNPMSTSTTPMPIDVHT